MSEPGDTLFVAEVSSNHNCDLDRCLAFIDTAAEIGCDAVKFQLFKIDKLFAPEILAKSAEHRRRKEWELPVEFLPELAQRCEEAGIMFSCTPFYLEAVEELMPYVAFYKVASYELLWDDLLRECAQTGKPVVLSTGMATLDEIHHAVEVILSNMSSSSLIPHPSSLARLTLLHCVSGYPCPPDQCNLAAIETLRNEFGSAGHSHTPTLPHSHTVSVGWSDHSVNPDVICRAVLRWHASMIEFHMDLDGKGAEFSGGHCWLPHQIAPVIASHRDNEEQGTKNQAQTDEVRFPMDGNGVKIPAPSELPDREWRADPTDGLRPLKRIRKDYQDGRKSEERTAGSVRFDQ